MIKLIAVAFAALIGAVANHDVARASESALTREQRPTPVVTLEGVTVWSSFRSGRYRLIARRLGRTLLLPVKSRAVPFDADLGLDHRGRVVLVYSRCGEEARDDFFARKCDLFGYDFDLRRERRLMQTARPGYSETAPAVWRGRLAFARHLDPADRRVPALQRIVTLDGSGRERSTRGGTPAGPAIADPDGRVTRLDLVGSRIAFDWTFTADRCNTPSADDRDTSFPYGSELWSVTIGQQRKLVASGCSGDGSYVFAPSLTTSHLIFVRSTPDRRESVEATASGRGVQQTHTLSPSTTYLSTDGRRTAVVRSEQGLYIIATSGAPGNVCRVCITQEPGW